MTDQIEQFIADVESYHERLGVSVYDLGESVFIDQMGSSPKLHQWQAETDTAGQCLRESAQFLAAQIVADHPDVAEQLFRMPEMIAQDDASKFGEYVDGLVPKVRLVAAVSLRKTKLHASNA